MVLSRTWVSSVIAGLLGSWRCLRVYVSLGLAFDALAADTHDETLDEKAKDGSMKLLGGLFGSNSAPAKAAPAARQHAPRPAGNISRTLQPPLCSPPRPTPTPPFPRPPL